MLVVGLDGLGDSARGWWSFGLPECELHQLQTLQRHIIYLSSNSSFGDKLAVPVISPVTLALSSLGLVCVPLRCIKIVANITSEASGQWPFSPHYDAIGDVIFAFCRLFFSLVSAALRNLICGSRPGCLCRRRRWCAILLLLIYFTSHLSTLGLLQSSAGLPLPFLSSTFHCLQLQLWSASKLPLPSELWCS